MTTPAPAASPGEIPTIRLPALDASQVRSFPQMRQRLRRELLPEDRHSADTLAQAVDDREDARGTLLGGTLGGIAGGIAGMAYDGRARTPIGRLAVATSPLLGMAGGGTLGYLARDRAIQQRGNEALPGASDDYALRVARRHILDRYPGTTAEIEGNRMRVRRAPEPAAAPAPVETPKVAFVESLPTLAGLSVGYGPGRSVAGETAALVAPKGRVERSENWARNAAVVGAPLGGLVAMGLARKYRLAPRLGERIGKAFPEGLIAEPAVEQELANLGVPGVSAIGGSLVGGGLTGAAVGALQRLRGPVQNDRDKVAALKPSPMWSRIGGASSRRPLWMAQSGFTPTGFKTPAQRLSKSMDMGKVDGSKGLKPLDLGKMQQQVAAQSMGKTAEVEPWGEALLAITKAATGQPIPVKREREDAATGDETEPPIGKEAEDLGGQSFSTNQYSGVMNPPTLPYASGIPGRVAPPVKTKEAAPGLTPLARLNSSKAVGAPRVTPAPGPSIAQIAKPKGYGMPMSGAKKGNNTI
jgi:hypothetical protein